MSISSLQAGVTAESGTAPASVQAERRHKNRISLTMVSPSVLALLVWMAVPLAMTIYFSLIRYNLLYPGDDEFAGFIGTPKMAFLNGKVKAADAGQVTVSLEAGPEYSLPLDGRALKPGAAVTLGVRPEHIEAGAAEDSPFKVQLDVAEHLGSDTYCYVKAANGEALTVRAPGNFVPDYGDTVGLSPDLAHCHLFDADGKAVPKPGAPARAA